MIALVTGILFLCASAAGWVLFTLCLIDVLRYRRAARDWRPEQPQDGGGR